MLRAGPNRGIGGDGAAGIGAPEDPTPRPPPTHDTATQPVLGDLAPTRSGVPHLTGSEELPLSNDDFPLGPLGAGISYLRHLWDAYRLTTSMPTT